MRPPLTLSERQQRLIARAARGFRGDTRDQFLARVEHHLFGAPTDLAVSHAINIALDAMAPRVDGTNKTTRVPA
jgi:hypothetical protein